MSDQQSLSALTLSIDKLRTEVDNEYTDFIKVMTNSNRFRQAVSSSSNVTSMYNNFKTLTNNSNVSIVQDYQYVDSLQGSFKIYYNNVALKWNSAKRWISLNTGTDITFGIYDGPTVNRNSNGRIALFDRATGLALRHYGLGPLTFTQFQNNNSDMNWFINKTESGKYEIQNDWMINWNFLTLAYDAANDRLVTKYIHEPSRIKFTFGAGVPDQFLTPNKEGLYCRILTGYFNDNLDFVTNSSAVNTPYLETTTWSVLNGHRGSGYMMGVNNADWFTLVIKGYFYAPTSGTYTFKLYSDAASYMWLGSNASSGFTTANADIKNGGDHGMILKTTTKTLTGNTYYPLLIVYGDSTGQNDLRFTWVPPGGAETSSGSLFFSPPV